MCVCGEGGVRVRVRVTVLPGHSPRLSRLSDRFDFVSRKDRAGAALGQRRAAGGGGMQVRAAHPRLGHPGALSQRTPLGVEQWGRSCSAPGSALPLFTALLPGCGSGHSEANRANAISETRPKIAKEETKQRQIDSDKIGAKLPELKSVSLCYRNL